jgi:hypothetical protein
MKIARGVSVALFAVGVLVATACSNDTVNAERTAACKDSGNGRMCGICCKTKSSKFTQEGTTGTCSCIGAVEK